LGAVDSVVQFFSSLGGSEREFGHSELSRKLAAPKKCRPNQLFENRQREQVKQAAHSLRCAVEKLVCLSSTSNADTVLKTMAPDIRSRFSRLRLRLIEFRTDGGRVQHSSTSKDMAADLDNFIEISDYLERTGGREVPGDLRQEYVIFCQRHLQDLENHSCALRRKNTQDRSSDRIQTATRISMLKERFEAGATDPAAKSTSLVLKPPPQLVDIITIHL
jgi:hypothetical protein